ncbi:ATP-binding cassette domain-containing protein [Alcaligenaceae bacterium CGII-47]|nr:ATP-binding cassette domain-containing protein [Alcaligenaceae bacterium CGII-47]
MLEVCGLTIHRGAQLLIGPLDFAVSAGQIQAIMGPSGSGKSTLLKWMIGNTDTAFRYRGDLQLNGQRITTLPTEQRHIGILFQDDLLFPHMSVGRNLAFALPADLVGARQRRQMVDQVLSKIGLAGMHDRDPATLSGGQRARASVARALMAQPHALLLDEPFSRLDAVLREQFRTFVFDWIARQNIPAILVTHDRADIPDPSLLIEL